MLASSSKKDSISWQKVDNVEGNVPEARHSFSMCYNYGSKQSLVFGGRNSEGKPFDDRVYLLKLNIKSHEVKATWSVIENSSSPGCIAGHCCICYIDSMYLFGGQNKDGQYLNSLYKFDIKSGHWCEVRSKGDKPSPRAGHSMTSVGSRIYLFGGYSDSGVFNDLYCYDIKSSSWQKMQEQSNQPSPRFGSGLLGMRNTNDDGDLLSLLFGANNELQADDIFAYGSNSKAWCHRPSRGDLDGGRSFFMSSLIMAGKVFLFGGKSRGIPQNDSYVYNVLGGGWHILKADGKTAPSPRSAMGGYLQGLDTVVVFGGLDANNLQSLNDLWMAKM